MARIVLPGVAYHVTHRGNQRRDLFFGDRERQLYLADLAVWAEWLALAAPGDDEAFERLREATRTGRPCGDEAFVETIEERLGRTIGARRRGRKPNQRDIDENQMEMFK